MKETRDDFILTFEEIEEILGFGLPRSAPPRRMVGRRHAGASARSGAGDPSGRIRLAANAGRRQGPLPPAVDVAAPMTRWHRPISRSWCFPARRRCRCSRRRRTGFSPSAVSRSISSPRRIREEQREGLAAGRYQIVHGAADQCVALVEAAKVDAIDRGRRRQRLQSSVRPAGHRAHRRPARADARGRRRQHRLVVRALRHSQAARPFARRLSPSTRPARRSAASRRCATTSRWRRRSSTRRSPSTPAAPG